MRESGGDTLEELVKERDMLKKKRDILDAQLRDNRVLPVEVRKYMRHIFFMVILNLTAFQHLFLPWI